MSKFSDKISRGLVPDSEDWNQHLIESHKNVPSQTPAAFASYKTKSGLTSYHLLANSIDKLRGTHSTVLDLACGDGYLFPFLLNILGETGSIVGIDMSDGELNVARSRFSSNKRIQLHSSKAQALPLLDSSVDAIVSHMAFMLMLPLDPVVSEIKRVLKPGGTFSAIIGNSRGKGGLFGEIQKLTFQFVSSRYPKIGEAQLGDPRVQTDAGIGEIFAAAKGFESSIDFSEFALQVRVTPDGVWELMKNMYFVTMLSEPEKKQLCDELIGFSAASADPNGIVSFEFPMKMFTVRKI